MMGSGSEKGFTHQVAVDDNGEHFREFEALSLITQRLTTPKTGYMHTRQMHCEIYLRTKLREIRSLPAGPNSHCPQASTKLLTSTLI